MPFLEGKKLLRCILEKVQMICQKPCGKLTLYWGERGGREVKKAENRQIVPTILASIMVQTIKETFEDWKHSLG